MAQRTSSPPPLACALLISVLCLLGCAGSAPREPDAGPRDAGIADAGNIDAGIGDAGTIDAGIDAGTIDAGIDAGIIDGGLDAGPLDGGWTQDGPVNTTVPYWRLTFVDDFRGKTGSPDDAWCFDQMPAQCTIWSGGDQNDCDLSQTADPGIIPPIKANLAAALALYRPDTDWNAASEADVRAAYVELVAERTASLNKCNWTLYEMVNYMATDYQGHYSARFDPTRVTVDPTGKGYLELSATLAPVSYDCIYGGTLGGPNCQLYAFPAGVLSPTATLTTYWADPNPAYPGVYYAPINGQCSLGGTFTGVNCQVIAFPPYFLNANGPAYWVDPNPSWPGVYYANQTYSCYNNIEYSPSLDFINLTCPILDGALISNAATSPLADPSGATHPNGFTQYQGRFEVKARIPKGTGAFPAAWMMPIAGDWPYNGGEIDILEARDAADQAFQTYHTGKCYLASTGQEIAATGPGDCTNKGGESVELSVGNTAEQRQTDEFSTRDHVFSAEWTDGQISYYVNDSLTGTVSIGEAASMDPTTAPVSVDQLEASNFPTEPFYWILNHSTYVPTSEQAGWPSQTFYIDYVKDYARCTRNIEFCPCGGAFSEGVGCTMGHDEPLHCPVDVPNPTLVSGVYPAACAVADEDCPNGGTKAGALCEVYAFPPDQIRSGTTYSLDVPSATVYYAPITGQCTLGGTLVNGNCVIVTLPGDLLESGIAYSIDTTATTAGIYYTPDFRQ